MKNLSTDSPVDSHLKPVKDSDGTATSLEISTDKVRVKDFEVTGTTTGISTGSGISDIVEDTSPQLGGDLDLNSNSIDFPTTANISDCKDEDDMASNSATMLATQQSIKAYVDANAGGETSFFIPFGGYTATSTVNYYYIRNHGGGYYYWGQNLGNSLGSENKTYTVRSASYVAVQDCTIVKAYGYVWANGHTEDCDIHIIKSGTISQAENSTTVTLTDIGNTSLTMASSGYPQAFTVSITGDDEVDETQVIIVSVRRTSGSSGTKQFQLNGTLEFETR